MCGGRGHPIRMIALPGPYKGCFLRQELTPGVRTEDKMAPSAGSVIVTVQMLLIASKSQLGMMALACDPST